MTSTLIRLNADNATKPFFGLFVSDTKYDFYWLDGTSNLRKTRQTLPNKSRYVVLKFGGETSYLSRATAAHNSLTYRKIRNSAMRTAAQKQLKFGLIYVGKGTEFAVTTAKLWMGLILGNDRTAPYSHDVAVLKNVWGHKHGSTERTDDGVVSNTLMFGAVRSATVFIEDKLVDSRVSPDFKDWCLRWSVGNPTTCRTVDVGNIIFADEDAQTVRIRSMAGSAGLYNPYAAFETTPGTIHPQQSSLASVLGTTIHLATTYYGHQMAQQSPKLMRGLRRLFDDSPQLCFPVAKKCYEEFIRRVNLSTPMSVNPTIKLMVADDTFILPCLIVNSGSTVGQMVATYADGMYQIEYDAGDARVVEYVAYELKTRWSRPALPDAFTTTDVEKRDENKFWTSHLQALMQCVAAKFAHPTSVVHYCIQVVAIPQEPQVDSVDISTSLIKDEHVERVSNLSMEQVVYSHVLSSPELQFYSDDVLHVKRTSAVMFIMLIAVHDSQKGYVCEIETNSNVYTRVFPWVSRFTTKEPARTQNKFYENDAVNKLYGTPYTKDNILYIPLKIEQGNAYYVGFDPTNGQQTQETTKTQPTLKGRHSSTVEIGDCYAALGDDKSQFTAVAPPAFVITHNQNRSGIKPPWETQRRKLTYTSATFQDKFLDNDIHKDVDVQPTPTKRKTRTSRVLNPQTPPISDLTRVLNNEMTKTKQIFPLTRFLRTHLNLSGSTPRRIAADLKLDISMDGYLGPKADDDYRDAIAYHLVTQPEWSTKNGNILTKQDYTAIRQSDALNKNINWAHKQYDQLPPGIAAVGDDRWFCWKDWIGKLYVDGIRMAILWNHITDAENKSTTWEFNDVPQDKGDIVAFRKWWSQSSIVRAQRSGFVFSRYIRATKTWTLVTSA
jgi:hypothetical protein